MKDQKRDLLPFLLIAGLIILTVYLRIFSIDQFPPGYSQHTVTHGIYRLRIYHALYIEPSLENISNAYDLVMGEQHGPQSLLEALLTPFFGVGFDESRYMIAALGVCSVLLAVIFGIVSVGLGFGLSLGFITAISQFHITVSRYGDSEHINAYLHAYLLFIFAQLSLRKVASLPTAIWLGVCTGLSIYVYATNQFLVPILWIALMFCHWTLHSRFSKVIKQQAVVVCIAALIAAPQLEAYYRAGHYIPIRSGYGGSLYYINNVQQVFTAFYLAFKQLFIQVDDPWFMWDGRGGLIDPSLVLVLPGIFWFVRNFKDKSSRFLNALIVCLLVFGLLPAVVSPESPFRRMIIFLIGVDLLKGFGVYSLFGVLLPRMRRMVALPIGALALGTLIYYQYLIFTQTVKPFESFSGRWVAGVGRGVAAEQKNDTTVCIFLSSQSSPTERDVLTQLIWFNTNPQDHIVRLPGSVQIVSENELQSCKGTYIFISWFDNDFFNRHIRSTGETTHFVPDGKAEDMYGDLYHRYRVVP